MDYTVIGDAVNFVFKLQSLCRDWPNEILISETTVQAAKSNLNDAQIGIFKIKPTLEKIKIYRLNRDIKSRREKLKKS
jgi:class 3 adenylate cyclase